MPPVVHFSRRTCYAEPMKNGFWFIIAAGLIGTAFFVQSPYMAYGMYTFLLLIALANVSSRLWLSGLDCTRSISTNTLQQGESVEVEVTVENNRGWPIPWIYFEDYHPPDFPRRGDNKRLAALMPGRAITMHYTLDCPRRGYHRIGPLLMESGDLFGLQKRFRTGEQQEYISVLPTVAYIDTFNVSSKRPQGPVRISNKIYEDPTRINSIREYVPGDPMNTIHWKASARAGTLHVKTFEPSSVTGGTLILDLHDESYVPEQKEERMELAITTTASVAYLLQMSGEQVGMVTNGRDAAEVAKFVVDPKQTLSRYEVDEAVEIEDEDTRISPLSVQTMRSPIQAQRVIENLARILPGAGLDAVGMVMNSFQHLPRDAALLVVTPQVTEQLALTLGSMRLSGFNVSVFLIMAGKAYEEAAGLLAPHGIHTFDIDHVRKLHEISPARIGEVAS